MHKWEIPTTPLGNAKVAEFQSIKGDLLELILLILQDIFDQPFPLRNLELLAQSSAALSTTQTVVDREKAKMEKSELTRR